MMHWKTQDYTGHTLFIHTYPLLPVFQNYIEKDKTDSHPRVFWQGWKLYLRITQDNNNTGMLSLHRTTTATAWQTHTSFFRYLRTVISADIDIPGPRVGPDIRQWRIYGGGGEGGEGIPPSLCWSIFDKISLKNRQKKFCSNSTL